MQNASARIVIVITKLLPQRREKNCDLQDFSRKRRVHRLLNAVTQAA
jgi:hypothetical protein